MMDWPTWHALLQLQARYAQVLDNAQWDLWPDFFTDSATYKIIPRENHDRGLPLATLNLSSKGMLKDRVYGIQETLFHDPYYQRHVTGIPLVHHCDPTRIHCETHYAVFRTKLDKESTVFNVGRYLDVVALTPDGLKFEERLCVFDSEMIPNSIIYPI